MVLTGVLRISPERGLSLQYTQPGGKHPDRRLRGAPAQGPGAAHRANAVGIPGGRAPIASLLPIMRFDLAALYPRFAIRA